MGCHGPYIRTLYRSPLSLSASAQPSYTLDTAVKQRNIRVSRIRHRHAFHRIPPVGEPAVLHYESSTDQPLLHLEHAHTYTHTNKHLGWVSHLEPQAQLFPLRITITRSRVLSFSLGVQMPEPLLHETMAQSCGSKFPCLPFLATHANQCSFISAPDGHSKRHR